MKFIDCTYELHTPEILAIVNKPLHKKLGFTYSGTLKQAGYKGGHPLDFALYQLLLETPTYPGKLTRDILLNI